MVVIAAAAIIIIFSYLSLLQQVELSEIDVLIDRQKVDPLETTEGTHGVYVAAIGNDGSRLEDVTITLTGAGVNVAKKTDSNGEAHFGPLDFTIASGTYDNVQIDASYQGGNIESTISRSLLIIPD